MREHSLRLDRLLRTRPLVDRPPSASTVARAGLASSGGPSLAVSPREVTTRRIRHRRRPLAQASSAASPHEACAQSAPSLVGASSAAQPHHRPSLTNAAVSWAQSTTAAATIAPRLPVATVSVNSRPHQTWMKTTAELQRSKQPFWLATPPSHQMPRLNLVPVLCRDGQDVRTTLPSLPSRITR